MSFLDLIHSMTKNIKQKTLKEKHVSTKLTVSITTYSLAKM